MKRTKKDLMQSARIWEVKISQKDTKKQILEKIAIAMAIYKKILI